MRKALIIFLVLLSTAQSHAQIPYSPDDILRRELQARSISTTQVDWMAMDTLCAELRGQEEAHRNCIKQKVINKSEFQQDSAACLRQASMPQPEIPLQPLDLPSPPRDATEREKHDFYRKQHQLIYLARRRAEDPSFGDFSYATCMDKRRWRNPHRWQAGQDTQKPL